MGRMPGTHRATISTRSPSSSAGSVKELYGVGKNTVTGMRDALTTHPGTTIRNANPGIASMIGAAIAAEGVPTRVQISRMASTAAHASAWDIGRAAGTVGGNAALATVPAVAVSEISVLRRLRLARPRSVFDPPQVDGLEKWPSLKNLGNCIMIQRLMRVRVLFQFDANDGEWFEAVDDIRSHSGRLLDGPKIICRGQAPRPVSSFTPTRSIDSASTYRAMLCPQSRKETRRTQIIQKLKVTTFHVKVAE